MAATDRLIATLAAEMVGYSRLIRADEEDALELDDRDRFVYPKIVEHSGRIVRAAGDNLLVEFDSPTLAVRCAVELQSGIIDRNIRILPDRRIALRVGVAVGQVTGRGDDLVIRAVAALPKETLATLIKPAAEVCGERGDLALRLAALAEPAGICISGAVRKAICDQLPYTFKYIGKKNLEVRAAPVECYAMDADAVASVARGAAQNPHRQPRRLRSAAVAGGVFAAVGACGVALFAWLGTHSSTALIHTPVPAGSNVPSAGITADTAAFMSSPQRSPPMGGAAADTKTQAPPAPQTPTAGGMVADRSSHAPSPRPALSEIGAVVVRGKQASSAPPTTPDTGTAALEGSQAPAAVVRGKQEASALQIAPDSRAAVIRGNQAPSAPENAPDGATDVVRGTRAFSPRSSGPDQR